MRHNMGIANEKGLTLVEILAALVILGIVFVGFMTIFPQMTSINQKTGIKLQTMNMAKQELANIKGAPSFLINTNKVKGSTNLALYETYELSNSNGYHIEVDCHDTGTFTCSNSSEVDKGKRLHLIHIKVFKNGKLNSETFGYIEL